MRPARSRRRLLLWFFAAPILACAGGSAAIADEPQPKVASPFLVLIAPGSKQPVPPGAGGGPGTFLTPRGQFASANHGLPVVRFTPRSPHFATDAALDLIGTMGERAFAPRSEGGVWLDFSPDPEESAGSDLLLFGAGLSRGDDPSALSGLTGVGRETMTMTGRIGHSGLSLGAGVRTSRQLEPGAPAPDRSGFGYDFDVSYAFDSGSVSLSRFSGVDMNQFAREADVQGEHLALSGRYMAGRSVDLIASFAYSPETHSRTVDQGEADGWAMLTGLRLSF
ncbi:MAG: hypothetical protein WCF16_10480 [Alphaproteobacteria bacterium]